jgi:hypothetical protein
MLLLNAVAVRWRWHLLLALITTAYRCYWFPTGCGPYVSHSPLGSLSCPPSKRLFHHIDCLSLQTFCIIISSQATQRILMYIWIPQWPGGLSTLLLVLDPYSELRNHNLKLPKWLNRSFPDLETGRTSLTVVVVISNYFLAQVRRTDLKMVQLWYLVVRVYTKFMNKHTFSKLSHVVYV